MKNMTSNLASIVLQLLLCKPSVQHLRIYTSIFDLKACVMMDLANLGFEFSS